MIILVFLVWFSVFSVPTVWGLYLRMALLASSSPAILSRDHWLYKVTGCWWRYCPFEVSWMESASWMRAHSSNLNHASEERSEERDDPLCHWKPYVQGILEQGVCDWGNCKGSSGFCSSLHKWSHISGYCFRNHGPAPWWDHGFHFLIYVIEDGI